MTDTLMTNRLLFSALLLIGVQADPSAAATLARFSTSVESVANQFSAGTVHIADHLAAGTTLSMNDLVAGDSFDAELTIDNSGTLGLNYALSALTSGDAALASALELTVRARTSHPCATRDGVVLYAGSLASAALGDPAHGVQSGDRTLAAGSSETLCFTLEVPTTVTAQDTSVTAMFSFNAEQA